MFACARPEQKQASKSAVQKKEPEKTSTNLTGIPDKMKTRFENLSGFSFDDVRVHYNSDKPAQLQALAYTQGNQVYVGPGQEKHLGHELGHVVQQKQGIVEPTMQLQGVYVNNDNLLEREADFIENKVASYNTQGDLLNNTINRQTLQRFVVQRKGSPWPPLNTTETLVSGINVYAHTSGYKSWAINDKVYHINVQLGEFHVTFEGTVKGDKFEPGSKIHYYYKREGLECIPCRPPKGTKGEMFSRLPSAVQEFISENYNDLI